MNMASLPPKNEIREFWQWFESVAQQLATNSHPAILDQLNDHVTNLGDISWELGPGVGAENALVISPDGKPEWLPVTRDIVAMAPAIPGWEFHHARPPKQWDLQFAIECSSGEMLEIDARTWRYVLFEFPDGTFDLVIEQPNLVSAEHDDRWLACMILVDGLLGEATRLTFITDMDPVLTLPLEIAGNATPIGRLPTHFDSVLQSRGKPV
jgi:hypothetical protein